MHYVNPKDLWIASDVTKMKRKSFEKQKSFRKCMQETYTVTVMYVLACEHTSHVRVYEYYIV